MRKLLLLFDIYGTLTEPMQTITAETRAFFEQLAAQPHVQLGVVGGSDAAKAQHQLGPTYRSLFMHCFHENGCVYYRDGDLIHEENLEDFLGRDSLNRLVTFILGSLASVDVPFRTGTFIERRKCMLNISPIGRACTAAQREEFFKYDKVHGVRESIVKAITEEFPDLNVEIAVGGMISIDIFPKGLNKTHALTFIPEEGDVEIHFWGDRVEAQGNDHEIYNSPRVVGQRVTSPEDTIRQVAELLS